MSHNTATTFTISHPILGVTENNLSLASQSLNFALFLENQILTLSSLGAKTEKSRKSLTITNLDTKYTYYYLFLLPYVRWED